MILPVRSLRFRILEFVWSPVPFLPPLFPMRTEPVRVGTNYTDYVRVTFTR